jgi:hypothetical protein
LIEILEKREQLRLEQGFSAREMDAGRPAPLFQHRENIIRDSSKLWPVQVTLLGEIALIAMLAPEIAGIGDVPLNMEGWTHKDSKGIPKQKLYPITYQLLLSFSSSYSWKIIFRRNIIMKSQVV